MFLKSVPYVYECACIINQFSARSKEHPYSSLISKKDMLIDKSFFFFWIILCDKPDVNQLNDLFLRQLKLERKLPAAVASKRCQHGQTTLKTGRHTGTMRTQPRTTRATPQQVDNFDRTWL